MMSLLTGRAITWASAIWEKGGEPISSFERFLTMFHQVFDHRSSGRQVGIQLMALRQGEQSMVDFTFVRSQLKVDGMIRN